MLFLSVTQITERLLNTSSLLSLLCCLLQARMALDKGAQAVIFDVSDDANAAAEVSAHTQTQLLQKSAQKCHTHISVFLFLL